MTPDSRMLWRKIRRTMSNGGETLSCTAVRKHGHVIAPLSFNHSLRSRDYKCQIALPLNNNSQSKQFFGWVFFFLLCAPTLKCRRPITAQHWTGSDTLLAVFRWICWNSPQFYFIFLIKAFALHLLNDWITNWEENGFRWASVAPSYRRSPKNQASRTFPTCVYFTALLNLSCVMSSCHYFHYFHVDGTIKRTLQVSRNLLYSRQSVKERRMPSFHSSSI